MLQPTGDKILVEEIKADELTSGGLVLPDQKTKEKTESGRVVAVGRGYTLRDGEILPLTVKEKDVILYETKYALEIEHDGKKYLLMQEGAVLAIVE